MYQTTLTRVTETASLNHTFAKQKFAEALLIILSASNVYEGLYSACVESFAQIDPVNDLPNQVSDGFRQIMLKVGCEFDNHEPELLHKALCSLDLKSANRVVDELRLLGTILSLRAS